jgi:hypothetical protein
MKTRRFVAIFAMLLTFSLSGAAQESAQQRKEQFQERLQKIKERLALTPEQVEQVRPVLTEEMQELKAVREKYSGGQSRRSRLQMGRELRDIRNSTDDKLRTILSKKQMDELKRIREESREQLRGRAG